MDSGPGSRERIGLAVFNKGKKNETYLVGYQDHFGRLNHDGPEFRISKNKLVGCGVAAATLLLAGAAAAIMYFI